MLTYLRRLVDERNSLTDLITQVGERAATDDRDLTESEREQLRNMQTRCAEIDTQVSEHNGQVESQRSWARLQDALNAARDNDGDGGNGNGNGGNGPRGRANVPAVRSWGEIVVESDALAAYHGRGESEHVNLSSVFETRAAIDPITVADLHAPNYVYTPTPYVMTTPLLDAISREVVSSNVVEWVSWDTANPTAPVVAEGALKPPADIVAVVVEATLDTYAHWKAITRQALEDAPRIRSIIETKLRNGLLMALEAATAAALTGTAAIPHVVNADLLAGIRVGMGRVQDAGYRPNFILMNPADWAAIDVAVMAGTLNGPIVAPNYWGLGVGASSAIPLGTAYVGDFKAAVTLFDRNATGVFVTDSHADNFLRNVLVILAETRAKIAVPDPLALAEVAAT